MENVLVESSYGKLRDGYLNTHWLQSVPDARRTIEAWRRGYHTERGHSPIGNATPFGFALGGSFRGSPRCFAQRAVEQPRATPGNLP
jgi:transposase InsO family protein